MHLLQKHKKKTKATCPRRNTHTRACTHARVSRFLQKYSSAACLSLKSIVIASSATGPTQNHFSQTTNPLQHFSPTTSFHLYIQPLPVRPRPSLPVTSLFGEHCSSISNLGRHGEMRSCTSWDPWLQERDRNQESQWEQVPTQVLKQPTVLHQRSMCWHVLGWALVSLLQQLENYHGDWLSSLWGRGDDCWALSWLVQPEGAGFSSWDQALRATYDCPHPAFCSPVGYT